MEKVFQKLDFSKNMYAIAMAYLEKHLKRLKTEGKGDCWLLSIMARGVDGGRRPHLLRPEGAPKRAVWGGEGRKGVSGPI